MTCFKEFVLYSVIYLSVSAESLIKLSVSVSVSAESHLCTFGLVSVSAETRNSLSVGL